MQPKQTPLIIRAGTSLMTHDHTRWVRFDKDTNAYCEVKRIRGFVQTVYHVKSGPQRGFYAPRGL